MLKTNMNRAAQQLGRLAKGKPKKITDQERKARAQRMAQARAKRWAKKCDK